MPADEQTLGITNFNEMIKNDSRVEKVILPLRDGITIIRKVKLSKFQNSNPKTQINPNFSNSKIPSNSTLDCLEF
jgi:hypothetical protein